jgi:hypothetical protein
MIKSVFQYLSGLSLPIVTHIFPLPTRVTTVIGSPMEMPHLENPSHEQIEHYLRLYIKHVTQLFHQHRATYAPNSETTISIV